VLARLLRYLCVHHVFREVEPNVFAINRISSTLDTGKSVNELIANPLERHDGTPGFPALIEHLQNEVYMSSTAAVEVLRDPVMKLSGEPNHAPFNRAFNTDLTIWDWLEQPEQHYNLRRFGVAMQGVATMQPASTILDGFNWNALGKDDVVADVGGGVGTVSLAIAKACPNVRFVVQDRAPVLEQGKQLWNTELPEAIKSGRVKLEAHDFFTPQPVKNASVFLLKHILHDWSDQYCTRILDRLRAAATPSTKLLLVENIIQHICHDPNVEGKDAIPGATPHEAPAPLLPTYGQINDMPYQIDFAMFLMMNAQDRTLGHFVQLLGASGWRIVKIYRTDRMGAFLQQIEAIPV